MAVRTDEVQLNISFITDEGKKMAAAIQQTKQYTSAINEAEASIKKAEKELAKANITEAKRAELLKKVADNELVVAANLKKIAQEGKSLEGIDLNNVVSQQLIDRAKQLEQAMRRIPSTAPEYAKLKTELTGITTQLRTLRSTPTAGGSDGGILGFLSGGIGKAVAGAAAAGLAFEGLKKAVTGASNLEQLTISFETFLGSADKAKSVIKDLKDFEVKTPFEAKQVNDAGRALLAFGFSTEELIPTLTAVGDVAAGTGKDFNELALIYGKAKAQGLIQGEELNQLAEAGIPIYKELGVVLGVSESKIRKLGEEGKIQFSDLEKVFKNLSGEGGRFAGLMEKQSQSLGGLYSTIKSQFDGILTSLGTALAPAIKELLGLFTELGKVLGPVLTPIFDGLGKSIQGLALLVKDTFSLFSLDNIQAALGSVGLGNLLGDYRKAREEKQKIDTEYDQRAKAEEARDDRQLSPQELEAIKERERIKASEAAEARKKEREKQAAKQKAAEDRARAALDKQLANVEANRTSQELVQEALYITGQISESDYQIEITRIQEEALRHRLDVFRTFGKETTVEAGKTANELLTIEQAKYDRLLDSTATIPTLPGRGLPASVGSQNENTGDRLDAAGAGADAAQGALKQKFEAALISEGDYQLRSLELKRAFIEEELAILRSATVQQTDEITSRENQKAEVEKKIAEQRLENAQRLADAKARAEQAGTEAFIAGTELAIELLGKDQEARRRHAQAIKAFQIGQVVVQGITEVQKIFAKNALLPGGTLLSIAESAPAALRTTAAIVKISRQKFARGGDTGNGYGAADETGERPAGIVHANEYVVPRWMRNVPGVENTLGWMEGIRMRGYATGGFVTANTTPNFSLSNTQNTAAAMSDKSAMAMQVAAQMLLTAANNFPRTVTGKWVYTDLETVETTITQVRSEAQI